MLHDLFGPVERQQPPGAEPVPAVAPLPAWRSLAGRLQARWGDRLYLGTSSWHFPGWAGWVWARPEPEARLSRRGLEAYARHPLLRTVSLDRAFYRPLPAAEYASLAQQVDADFRFVVKAPALLTDAVVRDPASGAPLGPNPAFLDPGQAQALCALPCAQGLGERLGVLVLQLSPLPAPWLREPTALLQRLAACWAALRAALPPTALLALELRDAALLTPALAAHLREHGVRYTLGLHDRLPAAEDQVPLLRASWPGDLVCRWNLQRGQRYTQARDAWSPFNRLQAEDLATRGALARVAAATLDAGHRAFITINNKAEGCAPASVVALAEALLAQAPVRR